MKGVRGRRAEPGRDEGKDRSRKAGRGRAGCGAAVEGSCWCHERPPGVWGCSAWLVWSEGLGEVCVYVSSHCLMHATHNASAGQAGGR